MMSKRPWSLLHTFQPGAVKQLFQLYNQWFLAKDVHFMPCHITGHATFLLLLLVTKKYTLGKILSQHAEKGEGHPLN